MSVIENPVAHLNESNNEESDEQNPTIKPVQPPSNGAACAVLDETPLTSTNKNKSPKRLDHEESHDHPAEASDVQSSDSKEDSVNITSDGTEASDVGRPAMELSKDKPDAPSEEHKDTPSTTCPVNQTAAPTNLLSIAEKMDSEESGDEEYIPGRRLEEEEEEEIEKEVDGDIQRQYSLRGGVKGTTVEEVKDVSHDTSDKKKAEDLWSTFKADVAMPIKRNAEKIVSAAKETTYDFAGEAVTIKEEIRNKRRSIVSTLGLDRKRRRESAPCMTRTKSSDSEVSSSTPSESTSSDVAATDSGSTEPQSGVKRPRTTSKLGTLVNRLTKRPKMTVLDKTALDWEKFKDNNSIKEDVKNEAKSEGYLEKQDFLSRADERQFELEKEIRLQQQRRRQMMNSKQF